MKSSQICTLIYIQMVIFFSFSCHIYERLKIFVFFLALISHLKLDEMIKYDNNINGNNIANDHITTKTDKRNTKSKWLVEM